MTELNNFKSVQERHTIGSTRKSTGIHMHHADADLSMDSNVQKLHMQHSYRD